MPLALPTMVVQPDLENNILVKVDEPVQGGVRYVGEARIESGSPADTDPVWRIRREILTGTQGYFEFANRAQFIGRWSARTTYFAAVPAIFNQYSTSFDGANDIAATTVTAYQFGRLTPFSVSFWIKPASLVNAQGIVAVKNTTGSIDGWSISQITSSSGVIRFQLMSNNTTNGIAVDTAAAALTVNVWQHITITYSGSSTAAGVIIYRNGAAVAKTTIQDNLTSGPTYTNFFSVGAFGNGSTNLNARLDELSVWNTALSAAQALELYNSGSPGDLFASSMAAALTSWYRMGDNDTFPTILDIGVNKYHLTMTNMTTGSFVADVPP